MKDAKAAFPARAASLAVCAFSNFVHAHLNYDLPAILADAHIHFRINNIIKKGFNYLHKSKSPALFCQLNSLQNYIWNGRTARFVTLQDAYRLRARKIQKNNNNNNIITTENIHSTDISR